MNKVCHRWTIGECKESAKRFERRYEWQLGDMNAYSAAYRNGWLEECCKHMPPIINDPTGQKIGDLIVLGLDTTTPKGSDAHRWLRCQCKCGKILSIRSHNLKKRQGLDCGCSQVFDDLVGKRFGRLSVLKFDKKTTKSGGSYNYYWLCRCDCGQEISTVRSNLTQGHTNSCGCILRERLDAHRLPSGVAAQHAVLGRYKNGAKTRGVDWCLSDVEAYALMAHSCHYCGGLPSNCTMRGDMHGAFIYTGIDRIDNTKGYATDNVSPCCRRCNIAKNDMSQSEFYQLISRIYVHSKAKIPNES